jgi:hypothetical protein
MLSVVMLNVANKPFKLRVIMLIVIMLNVIMLNINMLNVVMLSVVAPPDYRTELVTTVKSFVAQAPGFH